MFCFRLGVHATSPVHAHHSLVLKNLALRCGFRCASGASPVPKVSWFDRLLWLLGPRCWPGWKAESMPGQKFASRKDHFFVIITPQMRGLSSETSDVGFDISGFQQVV